MKTSEGSGTKIVGYSSGRFLSSRVRFWSGRLSKLVGLFGRVVKYFKNQKKGGFQVQIALRESIFIAFLWLFEEETDILACTNFKFDFSCSESYYPA